MKLIKNIYKFFDKKIIVPITKFFVNIGDKIKNIGQPLEIISKSKKGIIIISLILAVAVCYYIQGRSNSLLETNAKVLYNQPVTANYNEEEYVVEGLPKTVDITMIGNKANLYLANQLPSQNVVVDLSDLGVGSYDVKLKYKQAITSVQYKLDPSTVRVTISPKKSRTMSVSEDILNLSNLDAELAVKSVQLYKLKTNEEETGTKENADDRITINEVIVKGKEETINQVASVKALVDVTKLTDPQVGENLLRGANEVPIVAYDSNGKRLDVELVPSTVRAVVNIESPSKEVPIVVVPKGIENIVFGKSIEKINQSAETVTLYGKQEALDKINNIEVEIDVNNLNSNKKYTETLKKPKNVRKLSVSTVNIDVSLGDESSKEISGVRLSARNYNSSEYVVQVSDDSVNEIPVILKGVESVINDVKASDIEAYVDLKDYQEGTHEVKVKVAGNDNRIIYEPKISTVKIKIIKK